MTQDVVRLISISTWQYRYLFNYIFEHRGCLMVFSVTNAPCLLIKAGHVLCAPLASSFHVHWGAAAMLHHHCPPLMSPQVCAFAALLQHWRTSGAFLMGLRAFRRCLVARVAGGLPVPSPAPVPSRTPKGTLWKSRAAQ
jgi:hypothetical protein